MKILFLSTLLIITACGKGGGSSSAPLSSTPKTIKLVGNYQLKVLGCDTSTFTAIAYTDPGTVDEVRTDWNGSIDATGSTNIVLTGKEITWEVHSISGGCPLTMRLTRVAADFGYVENLVINSNGQIGQLDDI